MPLRCPRCATIVPDVPYPTCPTCGFQAPPEAPPQASLAARTDPAVAIVGLILNILLLPGLGSLIGGRTQDGIWQLVLVVGGALLMFLGVLLTVILIGILLLPVAGVMMLAGWVWGIITGVQMVQAAQAPR